MVVAGLLVMDSRAGTLIYSQRFSPAYGLASCDQGASKTLPVRAAHSLASPPRRLRSQRGTRCV